MLKLSNHNFIFLGILVKLKNNLLNFSLIAFSAFITGCTTVGSSGVVVGSSNSGSHIQGATQLRVFASMIEETRPHDDSLMPNTVILLDKKFWTWGGITSEARNRAMCKGFLDLQDGQAQHENNQGKPNLEHRVFNYMLLESPAVSFANRMRDNIGCDYVLDNYNYTEAKAEINIILPGTKTNRSPYLAVYEPKKSPHTSMVLALGTLGTTEIEYLVSNWESLVVAAYKKGTTFGDQDSAVYLAVMISEDPNLQDAVKKDLLNKLQVLKTTGKCGAELIAAGATLSLTSFLTATTTSCLAAIKEVRKEITGEK